MNTRPRATPRADWYMHGWFPIALVGLPSELETLRQYMRESSRFVAEGEVRFREQVEAHVRAERLEGEDSEAFYESRQEDMGRWEAGFPTLIASTMLIAACSVLEAGLMSVCKDLETQEEVPIATPWANLGRDQGITRSEAFLRINLGIDLALYPKWARVGDYFTVRDCVVHAQGDIGHMRRPAHFRAILRHIAHPGLAEGPYGNLVLQNAFVDSVVDEFEEFWRHLVSAFEGNAETGPRYWP